MPRLQPDPDARPADGRTLAGRAKTSRPLAARIERALAVLAKRSADPLPVALDRTEDDVVYVRLTAPAGPTFRAAIADAAPEIANVCAEVDRRRGLHAAFLKIEVLRSP